MTSLLHFQDYNQILHYGKLHDIIMKKRFWILLLIIGAALLIYPLIKTVTDRNTQPELSFDQSKWEYREKASYPYRDQMLKDLMEHNKLKYLGEKEVLTLLGEPERQDGDYLFYEINRTRFILFTLHTKTLVIKLSRDSTANKVMIHE